jgi:predicted DNA-binding protein
MKLHYKNRKKVIDKNKSIRFSDFDIDLIKKKAKEENRTFSNYIRNAVYIYMIAMELNKKGDVKTPPEQSQ